MNCSVLCSTVSLTISEPVLTPRNILKGLMQTNNNPNTGQKVTLVGASNLRNSVPHFDDTNLQFEDVTLPGWTATSENIAKLAADVNKADNSSAFVFDILSNSLGRLEQLDSTTSLPFKSNGVPVPDHEKPESRCRLSKAHN